MNEKLKNKIKELKEAQNEKKKAIANEKTLQESLNIKKRKISELEVALETTKSILAHAKEINKQKKG